MYLHYITTFFMILFQTQQRLYFSCHAFPIFAEDRMYCSFQFDLFFSPHQN